MPRFAILSHDHPSPHWDLFLEAGPVLRSWRLVAPLTAGTPTPAEPIANHRVAYLDYEGPVSGDRGSVSRVDSGHFTAEIDAADRTIVRITGARFVGRLTIARTDGGWTCTFDPA